MNQLETAYRAEIEAFRQARAGQDAADAWQYLECRPACKRDPVSGVIGV